MSRNLSGGRSGGSRSFGSSGPGGSRSFGGSHGGGTRRVSSGSGGSSYSGRSSTDVAGGAFILFRLFLLMTELFGGWAFLIVGGLAVVVFLLVVSYKAAIIGLIATVVFAILVCVLRMIGRRVKLKKNALIDIIDPNKYDQAVLRDPMFNRYLGKALHEKNLADASGEVYEAYIDQAVNRFDEFYKSYMKEDRDNGKRKEKG